MMRKMILIAAIAALAACSDQSTMTDDADVASVNDGTADAAPALLSVNETSWEYTRDGKPMQLSVDANGNYIITSGSEHIDHGTAVLKDGKACYTSAMTNAGEVCWSDAKVDVGGSGESVSDKGEKLQVKRVEYVPKTM